MEARNVKKSILPFVLMALVCSRALAGDFWGAWPEGTDPKVVGKRLAVNLLDRGDKYMVGRNGGLQYPEVHRR
jgi:hypothetical protein